MRKRSTFSKILIVLFSCVLLFLIAEWGYRLRIKGQLATIEKAEIADIPITYRVCSRMHVDYNEKYGEQPRPNDSCWFTAVDDGKVVGGMSVFKSNADGLDGRTTIEQYKKADIKILAFGDSFVHWYQDGDTWPDLLQKNIADSTKKTVAILNFGRGGFGLLQMLTLAADKIDELKPDMVFFGMIASSLENDRWWSNEVKENDYTRWVISSKKDNFTSVSNTSDVAQITVGTTSEWCKRQIAKPDSTDPVLERANEQCEQIETEAIKKQFDVPLNAWNHSYLLARLLKGTPITVKGPFLPTVKYNDYTKDAKAVSDANRIKASGVKVALIYMPSAGQIKNADKDLLSPRSHALMKSAGDLLNSPFYFLQKHYTCKLPAVIDLQPLDGHPNHAGLQFYADALTPMFLSKLKK